MIDIIINDIWDSFRFTDYHFNRYVWFIVQYIFRSKIYAYAKQQKRPNTGI